MRFYHSVSLLFSLSTLCAPLAEGRKPTLRGLLMVRQGVQNCVITSNAQPFVHPGGGNDGVTFTNSVNSEQEGCDLALRVSDVVCEKCDTSSGNLVDLHCKYTASGSSLTFKPIMGGNGAVIRWKVTGTGDAGSIEKWFGTCVAEKTSDLCRCLSIRAKLSNV